VAQPLTRVPNPSSLRASPTAPKKCPKNLIYDVNNKISSPTAPKTKPPYLGSPKTVVCRPQISVRLAHSQLY